MAASAFDDKASPPTATALHQALGRSGVLWTRLTATLQSTYGPLLEEWNYWGRKSGWSFRLKRGKRVIVYMTPCRGHFLASFALGEKACRAAHDTGLSPAILEVIEAAPRYPEGRGVRFPVRRASDVAAVEKVAAVKIAN